MFGKLSFENQVNVVGGAVMVLIGGYVLTSWVKARDLPACQSSYPPPTQMSLLRTNEAPMSPAELQARIGFGERGVLENATVVKTDGPEGWALNVKVGNPKENGPAVSFHWSPANIGNATSACLSYSVFIPRDFGFSQGGYLPGIIGDLVSAPKPGSGSQSGFGSRPHWNDNGVIAVEANTGDAAVGEGGQMIASKDIRIARGRWVRIDQEVVLNTPNAQNGQVRVWVDGKLAVANSKLAWRAHSGIRVAGVGADIGYTKIKSNILPNRTPSEIKISPMQLSWSSETATASSK